MSMTDIYTLQQDRETYMNQRDKVRQRALDRINKLKLDVVIRHFLKDVDVEENKTINFDDYCLKFYHYENSIIIDLHQSDKKNTVYQKEKSNNLVTIFRDGQWAEDLAKLYYNTSIEILAAEIECFSPIN